MFIDDVMKQTYPELSEPMMRPDAIFKIQNIADYYYSMPNMDMIDYKKDVFSFMLPFKSCWFEYKQPPRIILPDKSAMIDEFSKCPTGIYAFQTVAENMATIVGFNLYLEMHGIPRFIGAELLVCDDHGKYPNPVQFDPRMKDNHLKSISKNIKPLEMAASFLGLAIIPVVLTLNFLHCKNVARQEEFISKKLIKARQKRNKPYFEKYYTLQIEPMRKILDEQGEAKTKGLTHALHICRGHFKNFEGKGLFGKYKGTYWWPAHVRGDEKVGIIKKDYSI